MSKERPVIVCTSRGGVFFGYTGDSLGAPYLRLLRPRLAVYWSADVRGVLGLAVGGPTEGCRISPAPSSLALPERDITAVIDCSPEAVEAWEAAPWS